MTKEAIVIGAAPRGIRLVPGRALLGAVANPAIKALGSARIGACWADQKCTAGCGAGPSLGRGKQPGHGKQPGREKQPGHGAQPWAREPTCARETALGAGASLAHGKQPGHGNQSERGASLGHGPSPISRWTPTANEHRLTGRPTLLQNIPAEAFLQKRGHLTQLRLFARKPLFGCRASVMHLWVYHLHRRED